MATFRTNIAITAQVEGHYNSPWSRRPDELAWFESIGSGGGVTVDLPDAMLEGDRIPLAAFIAKMSADDASLITNRFRLSNFTDEQIAKVDFFREGTPSEPQYFVIEKPLRGGL
jgi:hypothetical protein